MEQMTNLLAVKSSPSLILFRPLLLFLLAILLFWRACFGIAGEEEATALLLLKWKDSLDNQNRPDSSLSSWSNTTAGPCKWHGITCNADSTVKGVNLTNLGISGTLREFPFGSLPNLTFLDVHINNLVGSIPREIRLLTELTYLDLSHNTFYGEIPPEICILTNLHFLYLYNNQYNGSIPEDIGKLYKLIDLELSNNSLEGPIPPSIGNLSGLATLFVNNNSLSGHIPSALGKLTNLSHLSVYRNQLSGPIPPELGNLKSIQRLSLSENNLSGSIPPSFGNLTRLCLLYLYSNQLTGPIPHELGNLKLLSDLELNNNNLTGSIPLSFENLTSIEILSLHANNLTGPIPLFIGNLTNLEILTMDGNRFNGSLPPNLCRGGNITWIGLNNNRLIGQIGPILKSCTRLVKLHLSRNQFSENITESFGVFSSLEVADLSYNNFYGEVSGSWGSCPNLTDLRIAHTNISGPLPHGLGNSTTLQSINLSWNNLTGEIPKEFGNLGAITRINMSHNRLSSRIPSEMGNLLNLERLDLSWNMLTSIPSSIGGMSRLNYLDLSHNELSKEIPSAIGMLTHLSELYLSENSLSGNIPLEFGGLENLVKLNLSRNNLSGPLNETLGKLKWLDSVDISYNNLSGQIPNTTAFRNASAANLQGNVGLCSDKDGLQPCPRPKVKSPKHNMFAIIFPILGGVLFLSILLAIFIFLRKRKQAETLEQGELFAIMTFDGIRVYDEIISATEGFDSMYFIGEGGFGSVYRAKLSSGLTVAVKKLHSIFEGGTERTYKEDFLNEVRALTKIRHRNIVRLYGFCLHRLHSFLVYEYLERGSLASVLRNEDEAKKLSWQRRVNIIKGVAHALSYMHHDCTVPIVHRDISSGNILLDSEYEARVSDFGTAKLIKLDTSSWTVIAGTYGYIAPELAYMVKVNEKCDVYSFGVLAVEVIKGQHPGENISSLFSTAASLKDVLDPRLHLPKPVVEQEIMTILDIAKACLDNNPSMRPSMKTISQTLSKAARPPPSRFQAVEMTAACSSTSG